VSPHEFLVQVRAELRKAFWQPAASVSNAARILLVILVMAIFIIGVELVATKVFGL
jgi:hypothetical protein